LSIYVPACTLPARSMASVTVDEDMNFMKDGRKKRTKGVGEFGRLNSIRESSPIYTVLHRETEQKAQAVGVGPGWEKGRVPRLHVATMMVSCEACDASGPTCR
jgi:hypothetical protein